MRIKNKVTFMPFKSVSKAFHRALGAILVPLEVFKTLQIHYKELFSGGGHLVVGGGHLVAVRGTRPGGYLVFGRIHMLDLRFS